MAGLMSETLGKVGLWEAEHKKYLDALKQYSPDDLKKALEYLRLEAAKAAIVKKTLENTK